MTVTMTRFVLFVILALYISSYCNSSKVNCAENYLQLYILPTDHLSDNFICPQNNCHTLNELSGSHSRLSLLKNQTILSLRLELLPGIHVINTIKEEPLIEGINSIVFTSNDDKATVWCIQRFIFDFVFVKEIEISNIEFKSCKSLAFLQGRNIKVANVTIENGGIAITIYCELSKNTTVTTDIYNVNITSNSIGIDYLTPTCDACIYTDMQLNLQNCNLNMARITINADCTQIYVQQVTIKQILNLNRFDHYGDALLIHNAAKVSLIDIIIENNTTPASMLNVFSLNSNTVIEINGYLIFRGNNNVHVVAMLYYIQSLTMFSNSKMEFYNNIGIRDHLLYFRNCDKVFLGGHQQTDVSLLFKNNVLHYNYIFLSAIMDIHFDNQSQNSNVLVTNSKLIFENNIVTALPERYRDIYYNKWMAVLYIVRSQVTFVNTSMLFINNSAPIGGVFVIVNSEILICDDFYAKFEKNKGKDGGAMSFYKKSYILHVGLQKKHNDIFRYNNSDITIKNWTFAHFIFNNNLAYNRGGAIYVEDLDYIENFYRAFSFTFLGYEVLGYKLKFDLYNNTAKVSGNEVYGGWIDQIKNAEFNITINNHYAVASNPLRICICANRSNPQNTTEKEITVFPGQMFQIEAVAVGQRYGIVPSIVTAQLLDSDGHLEQGQDVQSVGRECTTLYYTVYSNQNIETMKLTVGDQPFIDDSKFSVSGGSISYRYGKLSQDLIIRIKFNDCLLGFVFDTKRHACLCSPKINKHNGVYCDFDMYQITKSKQLWLSAPNELTVKDPGLIIHDFCPYDYCIQLADNITLSFHLEFPDDQCAFDRSGVLCGACQKNFSQIFGSSKCRECSNYMIFVIVPGVLIAGIILAVFLMFLNLTVAAGTINGLIFYANIIRVNQHNIFFPLKSWASLFLSTFIAWLNLDLGIETCFYDGLDAYVKTWLQFMFPLYIWLIVVLVIVSSHYSTIVSRLTGNNSVSVLATLFLLSYTKILRLVIIVFSSTTLEYPDGFIKRVWLYDGNLEFFGRKHAILFVVSLLFLILLSLPYTFSLVSIQWLQRFSHFRLLSWVHQLMPLFDAYTGPYKHKHRYWTGLLLLIRVLFLVIFTQNTTNNPAINLLAISVISSIILAYFCYMQVYKSLLNTVLEMISLLNIGLLSIASSYQLLNNQNSMLTTSISVSIAFITFTFIVLYHTSVKLASMKICKGMKVHLNSAIAKVKKDKRLEEIEEQHPQGQAMASLVTHTSIELHEPLIEGQ